jgi:ubiquinone/menaquinone biosynthesis C-methylase UbiE
MQPLTHILHTFFYLLYHPFAWAYDLVSWMVSLGRWKNWVESVIPFIKGTRVLELGHGPGHLQRILRDQNLLAIGLDESRQMGNLAKKCLFHNGYTQTQLVRGLAQSLPFPANAIDTVVATFPAEYIFEQQTLLEVRRTLKNGGRLIVLPVAWITGKGVLDKFLAWLFRFTGQTPSDPILEVTEKLKEPFEKAGFVVETRQVEVKSSLLLVLIATNKKEPMLKS